MSTQSIAVSRAIALLNAAKVQYKILTEDGAEYGTLQVVYPKQKKRIYTRPRGEMRDYYLPFVKDQQPGETVRIPFGPYEAEDIRGPLCGYCSINWGNGSYITTIDRIGSFVEVLRVE